MEEKLNIKINLMASGNYDDVVLYPSATNNTFLEGVENGLYIAVNDLLPAMRTFSNTRLRPNLKN